MAKVGLGSARGGQGTASGKTKGSRGISNTPQGAGDSTEKTRKAFSEVGWPGDQDSRATSGDRTQSAR